MSIPCLQSGDGPMGLPVQSRRLSLREVGHMPGISYPTEGTQPSPFSPFQ